MVTQTISSFKDNIHRRLTNPFLGTFTFVYIIKNWILFYGIFNFDNNETQLTKIEYIKKYFQDNDPKMILVESILYSLGILIATYLLMAVAKLIVDSYNELLVPQITKITNKGKIVERSTYLQLQIDKDLLEIQCEKEKEDRLKAQKARDDNESKYLELKMSDKSTEEVANLKEEIQFSNLKLEQLSNELNISQKAKQEIESLLSKFKDENDRIKAENDRIMTEFIEEKDKDKKQYFEEVDRLMTKITKLENESHHNIQIESKQKEKELEILKNKYELEALSNNTRMQSIIDNREEEINNIQEIIKEYELEIQFLKNENEELKYSYNQNKRREIDLAQKLYLRIKNEGLDNLFEILFNKSKTGESIRLGEYDLNFFLTNNIISLTAPSKYDNKSTVTFTELGNNVYNLKILEVNRKFELDNIYKDIIERFPIGRLAAHLINNNDIKKDEIIEELLHFTHGNDSDRVYGDNKSRMDAQNFIDRLNLI